MKTKFLFFLTFSLNLFAAGQFEVNNHSEVIEFMHENKMLSSQTLVVYDIDNTLLRSNHLFGSDQWFNWQFTELTNQSDLSMAKSFPELLEIQNQIFSLGKMNIVESSLIQYIKHLKASGVSIIALTSRGPDMKEVTMRELNRNQIDFNDSKLGYDLTPEFTINGKTEKLIYQNGIFMTSGLNKGEMLIGLLKKFKRQFKHIIFIDDHKKHTERVYSVLAAESLDINTFRYGHEDIRVKMFNQGDKSEFINLGKNLNQLKNILRK